jgi:nitrite reductase/ring-hydroxylating ferredoxin subunit
MDSVNSRKQKAIHFTRRMFLQLGLWVSGLASAWGIFKFLSYETPMENLLPSVTLDQPFAYTLGTVIYIPEVRAWLIHDKDGIYAVSSTCTHLGCIINQKEEIFVCPCHGSQFDLSGKVVRGPAISSLDHFDVSLSQDGRVVIDRRVSVTLTKRLKLEG